MRDSLTAAPDPSPSSVKFTRKPFKGSSLRKSININDDGVSSGPATSAAADDDDDDGPAVVRPAISRSGSTKLKKKASSSRLSFGVTDPAGDSEGADGRQPITPKKTSTLSQRATENSAFRSSLSSRKLPTRSFGPEAEETSYSKEYLEELQSSTPNTPQNIAHLRIHDDDNEPSSTGAAIGSDAMDLDPSELEGAVVVPQADLSMSTFNTGSSHIPSAVEIRAKKERRARLAAEGGAYNSENDDEDNYISLAPNKKKDDTRLIAEDEDLGEGYDEFVEDARLELGKKGEREAARRHRREMAELIDAAEGADGDDGDEGDADSDAERTAAYEAAQTRAAMGVGHHHITAEKDSGVSGGTGLVIPRMRALPELGESLARMRGLVQGVEEQAAAKRARIEALERERREIVAREAEVQEVLNQAGVKYQSALGARPEDGGGVVDPLRLAAESPLRAGTTIPPAQRGLESFGTPSRAQEYDDDEDEEMAG